MLEIIVTMKCQSENLNIISYEIGIMTVLLRVRDEGIAFRGECATFGKRVRWQQVCFHGTCSTCLSSNAPSSSLKNTRANNYRKSKLFLGAKSFMRNLNLHSPLLVPDPIVFDAGLVVKKLNLHSPLLVPDPIVFDAGLVVKKLLPSFLFIIQP